MICINDKNNYTDDQFGIMAYRGVKGTLPNGHSYTYEYNALKSNYNNSPGKFLSEHCQCNIQPTVSAPSAKTGNFITPNTPDQTYYYKVTYSVDAPVDIQHYRNVVNYV